MTFSEFLTSKVHAGTIIKVVWPEKGRSATGHPADFKGEVTMLSLTVFDFLVTQHDKTLCDYDVIMWLTRDKNTMY